jgi:hypothetical protein
MAGFARRGYAGHTGEIARPKLTFQLDHSIKADHQVKRLKDLELENNRLRKAVSDLTLDKLILTEAAKGNF